MEDTAESLQTREEKEIIAKRTTTLMYGAGADTVRIPVPKTGIELNAASDRVSPS
jgi:hypothetical protein